MTFFSVSYPVGRVRRGVSSGRVQGPGLMIVFSSACHFKLQTMRHSHLFLGSEAAGIPKTIIFPVWNLEGRKYKHPGVITPVDQPGQKLTREAELYLSK